MAKAHEYADFPEGCWPSLRLSTAIVQHAPAGPAAITSLRRTGRSMKRLMTGLAVAATALTATVMIAGSAHAGVQPPPGVPPNFGTSVLQSRGASIHLRWRRRRMQQRGGAPAYFALAGGPSDPCLTCAVCDRSRAQGAITSAVRVLEDAENALREDPQVNVSAAAYSARTVAGALYPGWSRPDHTHIMIIRVCPARPCSQALHQCTSDIVRPSYTGCRSA